MQKIAELRGNGYNAFLINQVVARDMYLTAGQILKNRYEISQLLGQGGFGAVYQAHDQILDITVAIKINTDLSPNATKQFEQEAKMLARLRHANLPRVSDYFTVAGEGHYLVMDFIAGQNLAQFITQHGLPTEVQAIRVIKQVCNALEYLHEQTPPIIHRDIKPANILITPQGQAILVDFGIAKFYHTYKSTSTGARGLTPGYAPPEQYSNGRTDTRSDIYALGATIYTLTTGKIPPEAITRIVHNTPIPSPRQFNAGLSQRFEELILKAMAITVSDRFQTASLLQHALLKPSKTRHVHSPKVKTVPIRNHFNWGCTIALLLLIFVMIEGICGLLFIRDNSFNFISAIPIRSTNLTRIDYQFSVTTTPTPTLQIASEFYPFELPTPIETSTPTVTSTPTATATPTKTLTLIPTMTPIATISPTRIIPTATPTFRPTATFTPQPPTSTPDYPIVLMQQYAGSRANEVYFAGSINDNYGQSVNGYSVLLDNGYFQVLSHPTGPSKWATNNPNGQWNVRLYNVNDAQGTWRVSVVAYQCNFEQGFDAQCKNYTTLSNVAVVQVNAPNGANFTLDWLCKYNCNNGLYPVATPTPMRPQPTLTPTYTPTRTPRPTATSPFIPPISPLPKP